MIAVRGLFVVHCAKWRKCLVNQGKESGYTQLVFSVRPKIETCVPGLLLPRYDTQEREFKFDEMGWKKNIKKVIFFSIRCVLEVWSRLLTELSQENSRTENCPGSS